MPRPWTMVVSAWAALAQGRKYELEVINIEKSLDPEGALVTLVHRHCDQCGRRHTIHLDSCRPDGLTAEFFRACGQEVKPNARLRPTDCLGRTVFATFRTKAGEDSEIVSFEPIIKEVAHDPTST